jgi:hypothetical protein
MKYIITLIIILALIPFINSQSLNADIPTYARNTNITISVPCAFNGITCPASTVCNVTIIDPKSVTIFNNEPMTKVDAVFEIDLNVSQTSELGQHEFTPTCCTGSRCRTEFLHYRITPSGAEPLSSGQGTILLSILGVMLLVCIIFFVIGFRSENIVAKTSGFSGGVIMILIMILYSMVIINEVIAASPSLIAGYEVFLFVMRIIGTVLILALIIILFLVMAKAWKIKRGLIDK